MYNVTRNYFNGGSQGNANGRYYPNRVVKSGLTLEEAQAHCSDPNTSSSTATSAVAKRRTRERGPWFDSYTECGR